MGWGGWAGFKELRIFERWSWQRRKRREPLGACPRRSRTTGRFLDGPRRDLLVVFGAAPSCPLPHTPAMLLSLTAVLGVSVVARTASIPPGLFNQQLYSKFETTGSTASSAWPEYTTPSGSAWKSFPATEWTSSFLSASLYLLDRRHTVLCPSTTPVASNGSTTNWLSLARSSSAGLYVPDSALSTTHDVGFLSWPMQYELLLDSTNATASSAVLDMAKHLSARFSKIVGCTLSWTTDSSNFEVIMDNMMNLQLLVFASSRTGNSTYLQMAESHANKTQKNHVREDYSSFHVVDYSPTTGAVIWQGTSQGYSNSSTWSRGQGWGIYGFAQMYNATGYHEYLDTSRAMASWYLAHLPSSGAPYWDFNAPLPTTLDTSSGTLVASALLFLSTIETRLSNATGASHWNSAAITLLSSLATQGITGWSGVSILGNGTVNNRAATPNNNTGIIYGDYYWVEAGNRLLEMGLVACTDGSLAVGAPASAAPSSSPSLLASSSDTSGSESATSVMGDSAPSSAAPEASTSNEASATGGSLAASSSSVSTSNQSPFRIAEIVAGVAAGLAIMGAAAFFLLRHRGTSEGIYGVAGQASDSDEDGGLLSDAGGGTSGWRRRPREK